MTAQKKKTTKTRSPTAKPKAQKTKPPKALEMCPWAPPNAGGRPRVELELETIKKCASILCTYAEAAAFMEVSVRTFERRMAENGPEREVWDAGIRIGTMSIRRHQFSLAKTNATMAIWLGKQYLGQKDEATVNLGGSITVENEEKAAEAAVNKLADNVVRLADERAKREAA